MALTKIPLKTCYLTLFVEGENAMVFHHLQQSLIQLSPLSVSLLLAVEQGLNKQQILNQMSQLSGCAVGDIAKHFVKINSLFSTEQQQTQYLDARYPEIDAQHSFTRDAAQLIVDVNQSYFAIESDSLDFTLAVVELLEPRIVISERIDFHIQIIKQGDDKFALYCNGVCFANNTPYLALMPEMIERMQVLAYQRHDYLICFHGAALANDTHCILLPGRSGAGKSTLAAQMAHRGFHLYSDEMIVFDSQFNLLPIQLPMAIKSGSWSVLATQYPELAKTTSWQKSDGRIVKYLWPTSFASQLASNCLLTLVNPEYIHEDAGDMYFTDCQETQIGVIDTIAMLVNSGYQIHKTLDLQLVEALIDFLSSMTRYQLRYSCSQSALNRLLG